jgi:methyl-accepting chemotaxis protein
MRIIVIIVGMSLAVIGLTLILFFTTQNVKQTGLDDAENAMMNGQREKIKLGVQTIAFALSKALAGVDDPQEQHDIISVYIKDFRFEDDLSGYYFTYKGTVIFMHPTLPQREGEDLGQTADADGVYYVRQLYENAQKGGGFVSFIFPKPGPNGNMENAPKLAYVEYIPGTDIWISTGIYVDNVDAAKVEMEKDINGKYMRVMFIIIGGVLAFVFAVMTPFSIFIFRSITKPLNETIIAAGRLAAGTMDMDIAVSGNDEITVLEKSFVIMTQNLRSTFSKIQTQERESAIQAERARKANEKIMGIAVRVERAAYDVENAINSISDSATAVKTGDDNQTGMIAEIRSSMEQLSSGVLRITESAETAADKSEESNGRVRSGVAMAQESGKAMEELHRVAAGLTGNINKLGEQSNNIGAIMRVIADIASQINLLAMNASIEAAHAGETGKGFAVVAGEVRNLAEKTRSTASEVDASIRDMQNLTQINIAGMNNAAESISKVMALSGKTAASLSEASVTVNDVMLHVQSIAAAAGRQSASSKAITSLVNDVSGVALSNDKAISKVDEELQALKKKSAELLELVSELRRE